MGGQSIANIYDYTYALDVLKPDVAVKVVFVRNGDKKDTMLTPGARR
jgi:S1-C subfamily serine protease